MRAYHFEDLDYSITAEVRVDLALGRECPVIDFKVYPITGRYPVEEGSEGLGLQWQKSTSDDSTTDKFSEAEEFMCGSVKWDGCSNWDTQPVNLIQWHFCSPAAAFKIGILLGRLYLIAEDMLGNFDVNVLEDLKAGQEELIEFDVSKYVVAEENI